MSYTDFEFLFNIIMKTANFRICTLQPILEKFLKIENDYSAALKIGEELLVGTLSSSGL